MGQRKGLTTTGVTATIQTVMTKIIPDKAPERGKTMIEVVAPLAAARGEERTNRLMTENFCIQPSIEQILALQFNQEVTPK